METVYTKKAVPETADPGKYTSAEFIYSEFVEIKNNDFFDIKMMYPLMQMEHAYKSCLVRREVYDRLKQAAQKLPQGYKFRLWDGWRPFALQKELYDVYATKIIRDFELADATKAQKNSVIRKFVSEPVSDKEIAPVHTTGGAVDLTILDAQGRELDMGTKFDEFSDRTHTAYYESERNIEVRQNRRLLYHIMTEAGFTNLPSEWWHYDYGNRFWAFYKKCPALYQGVFTKEELHGKEGECIR
nr:M15 family metallopeptidase [Lachnospiraceae bacterium]